MRRLVCSAVVSPKATSYCEKTEYDDEPGCVLSTVWGQPSITVASYLHVLQASCRVQGMK